jgi:hypothetical protein
MKDWNIPGLALGIVYKDQLVYAKGLVFVIALEEPF